MFFTSFYQRLRARDAGPKGGRWLKLVERVVDFIGIVIATGWFLALLLSHIKMITQPGPQEYNEPAILHVTWLLDHGRNPYTADELPAALYCFSPFYNYVVLALKPLFGADYTAHRMLNLVFLLGSLGLMARLIYRAGAGLGIALLCAVFYYWMCLHNIMITARPDALGLFLFLLGIFVPWERNYARWPSVFGLACAVVAFQCKFYFALAGGATLLGVFFVRSKREACWLGVGYFSLLALSFVVCDRLFPYYYIATVVIQQGGAAVNSGEDVSLLHTALLFERGWPFLLLMVSGFILWLKRRNPAGRPPDKPGGAEPRLWVLGSVFTLFLALVYFYMGRNGGAYFTYHLHLLFPLMFVLAATAITHRWIRIGFGFILLNFVMFSLGIPPVPDSGFSYGRLERLIFSTPGEILGLPSVSDVFDRDDRPVLHDGNTMFVGFAFANNGIARDPRIAVLARNYDAMAAEVVRKVKAHEYAVVLTEFDNAYFCPLAILEANYEKVEEVDYRTYFGHSPVFVWHPKRRVSPPPARP